MEAIGIKSHPQALRLSDDGESSVSVFYDSLDVNDPTHFRLSFRNLDNSSFPSRVAAHFFDAMRASSTYQFDKNSNEIDCSVVARHRSAETNPVAGAIGFYRFVYDIMTGLIRCPSFRYKIGDRSMDRRTKHYRSKKGMPVDLHVHSGGDEQSACTREYSFAMWRQS